MEEKNNKKWNLLEILGFFVALILVWGFIKISDYTETLENEIAKRDARIEYMLKNDSLLHQVLELETDTVNHLEFYIVRKKDGKIVSYNEMSKMLDSSRIKHIEDLIRLEEDKYELKIKNDAYDSVLHLIKLTYGIDYTLNIREDSFSVHLNTPNKLDSALILYPYFKSRIINLREDNGKLIFDIVQ